MYSTCLMMKCSSGSTSRLNILLQDQLRKVSHELNKARIKYFSKLSCNFLGHNIYNITKIALNISQRSPDFHLHCFKKELLAFAKPPLHKIKKKLSGPQSCGAFVVTFCVRQHSVWECLWLPVGYTLNAYFPYQQILKSTGTLQLCIRERGRMLIFHFKLLLFLAVLFVNFKFLCKFVLQRFSGVKWLFSYFFKF